MKTTQFAVPLAGSGTNKKTVVLTVLALAASGLAAPLTPAQPAGKPVKILFSDKVDDPNPVKVDLLLRPNTPQNFFVYVRNNSGKAVEATLELLAAGVPVPGARAKITLPVGTKAISLPKPPPPAPGEKPAPAPGEKPAPPPAWAAPLTVRLLGADNQELDKEEIDVKQATDYVKVTLVEFDPKPKDGKRNRLTVEVEALEKEKFSGPECRVELVLRPDRIPGLLPNQKREGTYGGVLAKPGAKLRLVAENLRFADDSDHSGPVYLTIDGYERAFMFQTTFVSQGVPARPRRTDRPVLRLDAPAAVIPSDKTRISLEIDNAPAGSIGELGFDRDNDGEFQEGELTTFRGDRRKEIVLGPPGPDGSTQFKALVHDWNPELNTTDIFGKRSLRLRLLNNNGLEVDVYDPKKDETAKEIVGSLILDGSPPENVKFVKAPALLEQGKPLSLQATGADPESGIKEVVFYLGTPVEDKMPPTAPKVVARPDADRKIWSGVLAVPADKVGTIDVTAQFTNGVGLSASESISVQITPPPPPGGKASISGKVIEGEYAQAGIPITLADLKGGDPQETKTNDKGEFTFGDLAPGKYRITAVRSASRTRGQDTIQVKESEKKTGVTIKLYRR